MSKVDVYVGGYLPIDTVTRAESERLASNACIIGNPLVMKYDAEAGDFGVFLPTGESVGIVHPKNRLALREALESGWTCNCFLSLVYYCGDKEKIFKGEIVYQFYNVKPTQTTEQANLDAYARKTAERLANGKRPKINLTGTGWDQVIATGDWVNDDVEQLPISTKHGSGTVVFKRRRSVGDRLALAAMARNPGCRIALTVALLIIASLVLFFVWKCSTGA